MFKNTKIKTLLTINLTFIIILLLTVGSFGLYGLNKSNLSLQTVFADRLVPASDLGDIRVLLMRNRLALNRALVFRNIEENNTALTQIQKNSAEIDRLWKKYIATYLIPEEKQLVANMEAAYKAYLT
ncbi:MAG: methyl-accepting chemotaxis protein, partial [Methyloglobulus sp.]|nr:methyl-accepting chemotaxis protein [Methyloglobulus sp.]